MPPQRQAAARTVLRMRYKGAADWTVVGTSMGRGPVDPPIPQRTQNFVTADGQQATRQLDIYTPVLNTTVRDRPATRALFNGLWCNGRDMDVQITDPEGNVVEFTGPVTLGIVYGQVRTMALRVEGSDEFTETPA